MKNNWLFAAGALALAFLGFGSAPVMDRPYQGGGGGGGNNTGGGLDGPTNQDPGDGPSSPPPVVNPPVVNPPAPTPGQPPLEFPGSTIPFDPTPPEVRPPGVPSDWLYNGSYWYKPNGDGSSNVDSWGNVTINWGDGTWSWTAKNGDGSVDHGSNSDVQNAERAWAIKYVYGGQPPSWAGPEW